MGYAVVKTCPKIAVAFMKQDFFTHYASHSCQIGVGIQDGAQADKAEATSEAVLSTQSHRREERVCRSYNFFQR